jgi:hypothetical protein
VSAIAPIANSIVVKVDKFGAFSLYDAIILALF